MNSLTVALKQLKPDFEVQFFFIPIRLKLLPFAFVVFTVTMELFFGSGPRPISTMMDTNGMRLRARVRVCLPFSVPSLCMRNFLSLAMAN